LDPDFHQPTFDIGDDQCLPWKARKNRRDCGNDSDTVEEGSRDQGDGGGGGGKEVPNFDRKTLEALGPLLDRLGRILIDVAPHVATIADSLPEPVMQPMRSETESAQNEEMQEPSIEETPVDPISLRPSWAQATAPSLFDSESNESATNNNNNNDSASTNPDYVDFVHGFINHRNESPSGRQSSSRRIQGEGGLGSSLLSAYLSSTLGSSENGTGNRVVRVGVNDGGGGGSGLGIQIHAIVTGPPGGGTQLPDFLENAGPENMRTNMNNTTANNNVPSIPSTDEEDTGVLDDLYSENPPEEDFRPNARHDDVEIEDDQRDDDIASANSSISGMPALLERDDDDSTSDDSHDNGSAMVPLLEIRENSFNDSESSDDSDGDDSNSIMPPLIRYGHAGFENDDSSIPSVDECVEESNTTRNDAINSEVVPLMINSRDDGDMEVCLSPKNDKGSDDKQGNTKNESDSQETSSVVQHVLGGNDDDCPEELSLDKCDHNVLHHEESEETSTNESQLSDEHPTVDISTGSNSISNSNGVIESSHPSLFNRIFRRRSQNN